MVIRKSPEVRGLRSSTEAMRAELEAGELSFDVNNLLGLYIYIYEPAAFRVYLALGFSYCFKRANINIVIQKYIFTPTYGTQISCPAVLGLAARHYELRISGYSYFHLFLFAVCVCVFFFQPA